MARRDIPLDAALFLIPFVLFGCASPAAYFKDRGRDALDVFTATIGYGVGAKGRAGPLQISLLIDVTGLGLRGGDILGPDDFAPKGYDTPEGWEASAVFFNYEQFGGGRTAMRRGKSVVYLSYIPFLRPINLYKYNEEEPDSLEWLEEREYRYIPWSFYTQFEFALALGPSFRFGVNPGEFVDLLLGIVGIDIFSDDLENMKPAINPL